MLCGCLGAVRAVCGCPLVAVCRLLVSEVKLQTFEACVRDEASSSLPAL